MCEGGAQQVDRYLPEGRYKIQNISFTLPTSQCCYGYCNSPLARKPWLPFYFYFGTGISRHWQGKPKAKRIQEVLAPRLSHSTQRNKLKLNREVTFFFFFKNRYGIIFRMQGNWETPRRGKQEILIYRYICGSCRIKQQSFYAIF